MYIITKDVLLEKAVRQWGSRTGRGVSQEGCAQDGWVSGKVYPAQFQHLSTGDYGV